MACKFSHRKRDLKNYHIKMLSSSLFLVGVLYTIRLSQPSLASRRGLDKAKGSVATQHNIVQLIDHDGWGGEYVM